MTEQILKIIVTFIGGFLILIYFWAEVSWSDKGILPKLFTIFVYGALTCLFIKYILPIAFKLLLYIRETALL